MTTDRIPHNTELEDLVIGSLLVDPAQTVSVRQAVALGDFYSDRARLAYEAILKLYESEMVDIVSVAKELKRTPVKQDYLSHCLSLIPHGLHAVYYAEQVRHLALLRRIITAMGKGAAKAYDENANVEAVIGDIMTDLIQIKGETVAKRRGFVRAADVMTESFAEFAVVSDKGVGSVRGVRSGFERLDLSIDGFEPGKLYIVAGRPGMGKTALLIRMAVEAARNGVTSAMFSLEQNSKAILERVVLADAGIDRFVARSVGLTDEQEGALIEACSNVSELPLWLDDASAISTSEANLDLLQLQSQQDIGLVLFDYIDLAGDKGSAKESEELRISTIGRRLKDMARTSNIPVIAAGQLNRKVEERSNKRPTLADLRYSGMLEAIADVVLMLYRHEYYAERGMVDPDKSKKNVLEVNVAKNKDGPTGKVAIFYEATTGRMGNLAKEELDHGETKGK